MVARVMRRLWAAGVQRMSMAQATSPRKRASSPKSPTMMSCGDVCAIASNGVEHGENAEDGHHWRKDHAEDAEGDVPLYSSCGNQLVVHHGLLN
jgi:hypothetical protein